MAGFFNDAVAGLGGLNPARSRRGRVAHHASQGAKENESGKRDGALIRLVARGRRWYEQLTRGEMPSVRAIANAEGLAERYVARVLAGALLAPDLIDKIVQGRQPVHFTVESLRRSPPLGWDEQRPRLGVTAR